MQSTMFMHMGRLNYTLARGCTAGKEARSAKYPAPAPRRILNIGIRIQAETEALERDCSLKFFKLIRSYKQYGSDNGAWRTYIHKPIPDGMNVPCHKSMRIAKVSV